MSKTKKKVQLYRRGKKTEEDSEYERYVREHKKRVRRAEREASGENLLVPEQ